MAKTLLNGVNEVLQRVHALDANDTLGSLTNEGKQTQIDLAVQVWNEQIDQLFFDTSMPHPNQLAENTITLSTDDRDYALQSDLIRLHWPLIDETNGRYIHEFPGGYLKLVESQPEPSNFTGLPLFAAIRPTDGELYLDAVPKSNENGLVYKYRYDKDTSISGSSDSMPFNDAVFRALVPAVAEIWKLYRMGRENFSQGSFRQSMGRAARILSETQPRDSWIPRRPVDPSLLDPFTSG